MKRLPEKLAMAAIILSCGFVAHSDPAAHDVSAKRAAAGAPHAGRLPHGAAALAHSLWVTRTVAARAEAP